VTIILSLLVKALYLHNKFQLQEIYCYALGIDKLQYALFTTRISGPYCFLLIYRLIT